MHIPRINPLWFVAVLVPVVVVVGVMSLWIGHKVKRRNSVRPGLYGVVGRMGAGKTMFAVERLLEAVAAGRSAFANFDVEGVTRIGSFAELVSVPEGSVVVVDEIQLWLPSTSRQFPPVLAAWFSQLRKRGITCYWTSQGVGHVAKRVRDLTFAYWEGTNRSAGHKYVLIEAPSYGKRDQVVLASLVVRRSAAAMASYDTTEIVEPPSDFELVHAPARSARPYLRVITGS